MKSRLISAVAFALALGAFQTQAEVIIAGDIAIGVNPEGHLNSSVGGVAVNGGSGSPTTTGIAYSGIDGLFRDATSPGCFCEGWGVSATSGGGSVTGHANRAVGGVVNLSVDSFVATPTSITSEVSLSSTPGISVTHEYAASADTDRLFEVVVTIANDTGADIDDVRYVRVMDWDVPLTEFREFVTIGGTATTTLLERSHDDGFDNPNPLLVTPPRTAGTLDVDFEDVGPSDHGAYFKFNFGTIADGDEFTFRIFYGAAATEAEADAALAAAGIELFSYGQSPADR